MGLPRLVTLSLCLACGFALAQEMPGHHDGDGQLALIDSLFDASKYDSIQTLIPIFTAQAIAANDSVQYARLLCARGRVMLMRGEYRGAEALLATTIHLAETQRDTLNLMRALGFKGLAVTGMGRSGEGETLQNRRLALAITVGNRRSEAWARSALAYLLLQRGESEAARDEYLRSAALFREGGYTRQELTPLIGLGRAFHMVGQIDDARATYQRTWIVATEIGDAVQAAYALNNLGVLESAFGDMTLAAQYYAQAYEAHTGVGYIRGAIVSATNVAAAKLYLGQYAEAAAILENAIATAERIGLQESLLGALADLGYVRLAQHRPSQAAAVFRRAIAINDIDGQGPIHDRFKVAFGLARSLAVRDSLDAAIGTLIAATSEARKQNNTRWMAPLGAALTTYLRQAGDVERAFTFGLEALAASRLLRGGSADPWVLLDLAICFSKTSQPDSAAAYAHAAVIQIEQARAAITEYDWRESFTQQQDFPLTETADIFLTRSNVPEAQSAQDAFDIIQRLKARTLIERITEPRGASERTLTGASPVTLHELQHDILEPGELLLDYTVGASFTLLFAVTQHTCRVVRIPVAQTELAQRVHLFGGALGSPPAGSNDRVLPRLQASMSAELFGEAAGACAQARRIVVVPDAFLSAVPFAALTIEGRLLGDGRDIETAPSATLLKVRRLRKPHPADFTTKMLALASANTTVDGRPLRGTLEEVRHLHRRFADVDRRIANADEATRAWEDVDRYEVLHIAAHVAVDVEKPWQSGIALGWRRPPQPKNAALVAIMSASDSAFVAEAIEGDRYLRARDIVDMEIPARLAVLSGCESAGGRTTFGEGVLGLSSAFLSAGVPAVVATLWPVADRETAFFMEAFYEHLADGKTVAGALGDAQAEIRARADTAHPFYWAGFVVIGDGGVAIELRRRRGLPGGILVWSLAAALIALGVATRRRRGLFFL